MGQPLSASEALAPELEINETKALRKSAPGPREVVDV